MEAGRALEPCPQARAPRVSTYGRFHVVSQARIISAQNILEITIVDPVGCERRADGEGLFAEKVEHIDAGPAESHDANPVRIDDVLFGEVFDGSLIHGLCAGYFVRLAGIDVRAV